MLVLPLERLQQQGDALVVVVEKLLDLPIRILQRSVVRREAHDGVQEVLVSHRYVGQDHPEEVVAVLGDAVVVVRHVVAEVGEVGAQVGRKLRPVGPYARGGEGALRHQRVPARSRGCC